MNILIVGRSIHHAVPLAAVLAAHGQHSVAWWGPYDDWLMIAAHHPDPVVRELEPSKIAHTDNLQGAVQTCHDLFIVASHFQARSLETLNEAARGLGGPRIPTLVVTRWDRAPRPSVDYLTVGLAPFSYHSERAGQRLLNLRRIDITRTRDIYEGTLKMAASRAWRTVDNKIPVYEHPAGPLLRDES